MTSIKVSVVIPCFNCEKTIRVCLSSILNSNIHPDEIEILAIDNNSTDRTKEIIQSFSRVKYIRENKQGRSFARNRGIYESKGELIAFIDSDVELEKNWIREASSMLSRYPLAGGTQGKIIPVGDSATNKWLDKYRYHTVKKSTKGSFILLDILSWETPMINSAACMYKRDALERNHGFDTKLVRHEDIDLSKRVFYSGYDICASPKAISYVHFHGEGIKEYLFRSFWHGYYKNDYSKKWEEIERNGQIGLNCDSVSNTKEYNQIDKSSFFYTTISSKQATSKLDWFWAVRYFSTKLIKSVITLDTFELFDFLSDIFQSAGRLYGSTNRGIRSKGSDTIDIPKRLDSFQFLGKKYCLPSYSRLIHLEKELILFNISTKTYESIPKHIQSIIINDDDSNAIEMYRRTMKEGLALAGITEVSA